MGTDLICAVEPQILNCVVRADPSEPINCVKGNQLFVIGNKSLNKLAPKVVENDTNLIPIGNPREEK